MEYLIELANQTHINEISKLIKLSARKLCITDYTPKQIEDALRGAWGLDNQLIEDETYYLILGNDEIIGCGGWSFRKTLFGSSARKDRDSERLDPISNAARIRAFFIHPNYVRKGLGKKLLIHCEQKAWDSGFTRLELGSTLPGVHLYKNQGYVMGKPYEFESSPDIFVTIIPMKKTLLSRPV